MVDRESTFLGMDLGKRGIARVALEIFGYLIVINVILRLES